MPEPRSADDRFIAAAFAAVDAGTFVKLVLGGPTGPGPHRYDLRPIAMRTGDKWAAVATTGKTQTQTNLEPASFGAWLADRLGEFRNGDLLTTEMTLHRTSVDGRSSLRRGPAQGGAPAPRAHDRAPQRRADLRNQPWAETMGLVQGGRPSAGHADKLRQIERLVELFDHAIAKREGPLTVLDLGCGRGLLTAALADHLARTRGEGSRVIGVEREPERTAAAAALGLPGLQFVTDLIAAADLPAADVVLALHACDTATDDALAAGIRSGAKTLFVSPCCHRELRPQLHAEGAIGDALRHGILADRQAEWVTDALRAQLLASAGFDVSVIEMVRSEHTPRNVLLVGHRDDNVDREAATVAARELARRFGVANQALAGHLGVTL